MKNQQLEIGLKASPCRPATFRQRRVARARWWFNQMRRVVDEAIEPAPAAPPEQTHFSLAQRR